MPEPKSYLAGVKAELRDLVDEIAQSQDELDVDSITNRIWKSYEPRLKESFLNGKKAGNGKLTAEERKPNPFRKG